MKEKHYFISSSAYEGDLVSIDYHKLDGFHFKPQNQEKYDGIVIDQVVVVKPSMIEKVLKKKIKRHLDGYLQLVIQSLDDEEGSNPTGLREALNDLTRYKSMVYNHYRIHLDEKYVDLLIKKMEILERELQNKLMSLEVFKYEQVDEEEHRRGR